MIGFGVFYFYSCCADLLTSAESGESRKEMYRSYLIFKSEIIKLQYEKIKRFNQTNLNQDFMCLKLFTWQFGEFLHYILFRVIILIFIFHKRNGIKLLTWNNFIFINIIHIIKLFIMYKIKKINCVL